MIVLDGYLLKEDFDPYLYFYEFLITTYLKHLDWRDTEWLYI